MEAQILATAPSVGMFYALTEAPDGSLHDWAVGSYAVYLVNGKRIGITVLHTLKSATLSLPVTLMSLILLTEHANERLFVDSNVDNWKDKSYDIHGAASFAYFTAPLVEVFAHAGAVTQRAKYINDLVPSNKSTFVFILQVL